MNIIKLATLSFALATASLGAGALHAADDAEALLRRADAVMGGTALKSIRFAGSGTGAIFGQAYKPGAAWPRATYSSFARVADYENAAFREDFARGRAEPTGGGALPLMGQGEQRATFFLRGADAWNQTAPTVFVPAPVALDTRIHDLWTSPHGVIKAALKNKAKLDFVTENGKSVARVSFTEPGRFTATAFIDDGYFVERVESRLPHPVAGDTASVTRYTSYRMFSGVAFPTRIVQAQGGHPVLDIAISEVQVNAPSGIVTPDNVKAAPERVTAEKAADGVWFMAGGSHNSVAIEMKDHFIVVEAPLYDGRSAAVFAEVIKLAGNKPVRYVINSHHHYDHAGGLRAAAAIGANVVVSANAKAFFDKAFANPNRISPDLLAKSGKRARVIGLNPKKHVFSDGTRTVEVYPIEDGVHSHGFNMVYLPKEKILIEADAYTPQPVGAKPPSPPNGNNVNLVENIEGKKLAVERILPLHGRMVTLHDLYTTAGRQH